MTDQDKKNSFKYASLPPHILKILLDKGTEPPFSGQFLEVETSGTFLCRGCGKALFRGQQQFTSQCGWPSFDDQLPEAIQTQPDADGLREEILCARCHGHLGHVFKGEGATPKNLRHCVNSLAIEFVNDDVVLDTEEIILAAGCFWGVQHLLNQLPGVLKTEVGYTGGDTNYPTYKQVCTKTTGHFESVRTLFNPEKISLEDVLKYFFEIHHFEQRNGQGPDIGSQYLSAIFYFNEKQKNIANNIIKLLTQKKFDIATQLLPVNIFWPAEEYHQDYYQKNDQDPYCHTKRKIF